jgi:hypothetical protein
MAKLAAAGRGRLPKSDFAGPDRSYPLPAPRHAPSSSSGRAI